MGPSLSHYTHCDGKKMGQLLSTPEPRGWEEIVSEELEGVSERGCAATKKKVVVPYPDDKVRNLGVTSNDWDDILEEFNNGMAGYWSSAAQTGPIALIFLVGIAVFFLMFFGVVGGGEGERRLEDGTCLAWDPSNEDDALACAAVTDLEDSDACEAVTARDGCYYNAGDCVEDCDEEVPIYMIPVVVAFFVVAAVRTGMKLQNMKHDGKLNNLLTEKVNSRFEARGLLVKLHVQVMRSGSQQDGSEHFSRFFCAYIRAAPSTATAVTAGMIQPRAAMAQAQPMQIQPTMQPLQVTVPAGAAGGRGRMAVVQQ